MCFFYVVIRLSTVIADGRVCPAMDRNPDVSQEQLQTWLSPLPAQQLLHLLLILGNDQHVARRIRDHITQDLQLRRLFVCKLSPDTSTDSLVMAFSPFGDIAEAGTLTQCHVCRLSFFSYPRVVLVSLSRHL